ncbi:MAG: response regulator [Actinobacteria bacterium]|nr:response regulator [Actinomycetota bacterium]
MARLNRRVAEWILSTIGEGVLVADLAEKIVFANDAAAAILKTPKTALIGQCLRNLPDFATQELTFETIERAVERPGERRVQTARIAGKALVLNCRYVVESKCLVITIRDITDLVKTSERVEAVLASTADGLLVLDEAGRTTHLNRAAETILNVTERDALGKTVGELHIREELADVLAGDEGLFKSEQRTEEEATVDEETEKYLKIVTTPVFDRQNTFLGHIKMLRDVTAEKRVERMKNEFISTVSHELRTPLTSIKGYVDLMLEGDAGDIGDIQRDFLKIVKQNSDRLVGLINDLLDLSRIESGRVQLRKDPVNLDEAIDDVLVTSRTLAEEKKQVITLVKPESLPIVIGDSDRITQVLMNLLSNAIKYTPEEGTIGITAVADKRFVKISVSDTGIGISPIDQVKLFEKFYRVDNSLTREVGGTGLGLSIVKTLVRMHGGDIWVESEAGKGSTFTFTLPAVGKVSLKSKEEPGTEEELPGAGRTVLVVDDEPDIVRLVQLQLDKDGYRVLTALSGEEALDIAKRERPDIITLDILMEGINGFEVIRRLDEDPETTSIPVIIVSIICDEEQCYSFGGASYLTKPIDREKLSLTVKRLIEKRDKERQVFILVIDDENGITGLIEEAFQTKEYAVYPARSVDEAISVGSTIKPNVIVLDAKMAAGDSHRIIERLRTCGGMSEAQIIMFTEYDAEKLADRMVVTDGDDRCSVASVDAIARKIDEVLEKAGVRGEQD